ncbi:hypothetical protein DFH28DRAFT_968297 [Melampsora americana]|nr:hypothetical protein DFH28DRAFT_968297 [Melampsora americana]
MSMDQPITSSSSSSINQHSASSSTSSTSSNQLQQLSNHMHSISLNHPSLSLAALTPEGTPPKAFSSNSSTSILHPPPNRTISPPTPAPSPQPQTDKDWSHLATHPQRIPSLRLDDPLTLLEAFSSLSLTSRAKFLNSLLPILNLNELTTLSGKILPRLKRDFLRELPIEISLHILSFVDDPKTLMRAGMVSRFWRSLVSDEATWKGMCWRRGFNNRNAPISLSERMEKERKGRVETYRAGVEERRRRKKALKHDQAAQRAPTSQDPSSSAAPAQTSPFRTLNLDQLINAPDSTSSTSLRLTRKSNPVTTGLGVETEELDHGYNGRFANPEHAPVTNLPYTLDPESHPDQLSTPYLSNPHQIPTFPFSRRSSYHDRITSPRLDGSTDPLQGLRSGTMSRMQSGAPTNIQTTSHNNLAALGIESSRGDSPISAVINLPMIKQPHRFDDASNSTSSSTHLDQLNSLTNTPTTANVLEMHPPHSASSSMAEETEYSPRPPFSYKSYFKRAYLTESNWLRGPGDLITMQTSQNYDGNEWVVTSLCFDDDWIVVGMATSKIHVFDARTGEFVRMLAGHELGVWSLALVSKGGIRDRRDPIPESSKKGKGVDVSDINIGNERSSASGSEWIASDHHFSSSSRGNGGGASMMRAKGGLGVSNTSSWDLPTRPTRSRSQQRTVTNSATIFPPVSAEMAQKDGTSTYPTPFPIFVPPENHGVETTQQSLQASLLGTSDETTTVTSVPMRAGRSMPAPISIPSDRSSSISSATTSSSHQVNYSSRRRSFGSLMTPHYLDESFRHGPASANLHAQSGGVIGGMGLGAGGPSAGNLQQSSACGISRGWGQKRSLVVSGGCDRDVRVWEVETGRCLHVLAGHSSTIRCMKVLEGRPIAISGSRDSTLRVWDIEQGVQKHLLVGHTLSVRAVEVHGNRAVSGSYDNTCRLWDVDTGECLKLLRGHYHQIYAVAFDGTRIASGSMDSTVCIWSAETGELLALLQGHTALVGQVQINGPSNVLVTGGSDGRVVVFSLESFECLHRLCAHDNSVTCLQFDDRFVVTGGNDGRVKLWDFKTGSFIRELAEPCEAVWRIVLRDDKAVLLCKRDGRTVMEVISFRPSLDSV